MAAETLRIWADQPSEAEIEAGWDATPKTNSSVTHLLQLGPTSLRLHSLLNTTTNCSMV